MEQSSAVSGFSLSDLLTRVVPGLTPLTPFLFGIYLFTPDLLPQRNVPLLGIAILAYLIGEFIDQIRSGLLRVPMSFRYFIYRETNQLEKMPKWYILLIRLQQKLPNQVSFYKDRPEEDRLTNQLNLDFRTDIESELAISLPENSPRHIYDLFLIYMKDDLSPRVRRFQSLAIFSTNFRIASAFGLVIYSYYGIVNLDSLFFRTMWVVSIAIAFFVVVLWSLLTMTHYQFDELLMKEYYMKRVNDRKEN